MKKFIKRPIVIEAEQWFKVKYDEETKTHNLNVDYYRNPKNSGENKCEHCSLPMHDHGWIDTLEGGHVVCPGDWIIKGIEGEYCPIKPNIFEKTYRKMV